MYAGCHSSECNSEMLPKMCLQDLEHKAHGHEAPEC